MTVYKRYDCVKRYDVMTVYVMTVYVMTVYKRYDCVKTCKQSLSRHSIEEFGWESCLFCYICPETL